MLTEYYFAVRYGDIIILLYHEDMMSVWELLFKNSQKEKALKRFLEYCYMIDPFVPAPRMFTLNPSPG